MNAEVISPQVISLGCRLNIAESETIRALLAVNTAGLPRLGEEGALVGLDWRVLLFSASMAG